MPNPNTSTPETKTKKRDIAARDFLAQYSGLTGENYTRDLKIYFAWCDANDIKVFKVTRVQIIQFMHHLTYERGNGASSVAGRISTVKCFYKIAVADRWLDRDPSVMVRPPKVQRDLSRLTGFTSDDMARITNLALDKRTPAHAALIGLMGTLGMRVSGACRVQIGDFATVDRGHRVLKWVGKGGKITEAPIPPNLFHVMTLTANGRTEGPLILRKDGKQMDRNRAYMWVKSMIKEAKLDPRLHPHSLKAGMLTVAIGAGIDLRIVADAGSHSDIKTTMGYDRNRKRLGQHPSYRIEAEISMAA